MIYLFDKTQNLTGVIDEHTEALSATLEMKINEASTLDFALPLDDDLSAKMAGVKYVGVPSPNSADKIVFLRLMTINDESDRVEYMAKELAYQELASGGYIEDKRPSESDAQTLMNIALDGSRYKLGVVNVPGKVKTNFYYTDHLSAISNVVELLGGEIYFYVSLTGSKITGRYMDYVAEQGTNTSKTFADGSNLITVERKRDMSSVYTAILPRGKGERVSSGEEDTPDGYGRRINIAGITWSKSNGNPLDKSAGEKILVDPDATAEYGNADGTPRLLLKTYDDIEDANILINKAYMDLMTMNKPAVQYSATVANVGDMQLGDTIVIMHSKRSMSYRTRVFHITYDLIDNTKTVAEFGNDLSKDSITSQINSISSNGATISDQVQWNISNGGHNNTSYGAQEPANPRKGDVWFKQLPNGNTEEYYFDDTVWVLGAKTDQQWQENQAIAQGTHTTFYGPANPVGAVKGDVWFKNDNNIPDGKSMYTYDGTNWIKFEGSADASRLQIGTIDASKINVMNVSASNITTGNLSANFLKGGQIDASQINVININASNMNSGTINTQLIDFSSSEWNFTLNNIGLTMIKKSDIGRKTTISPEKMTWQYTRSTGSIEPGFEIRMNYGVFGQTGGNNVDFLNIMSRKYTQNNPTNARGDGIALGRYNYINLSDIDDNDKIGVAYYSAVAASNNFSGNLNAVGARLGSQVEDGFHMYGQGDDAGYTGHIWSDTIHTFRDVVWFNGNRPEVAAVDMKGFILNTDDWGMQLVAGAGNSGIAISGGTVYMILNGQYYDMKNYIK
jgi:phage minor structural protein